MAIQKSAAAPEAPAARKARRAAHRRAALRILITAAVLAAVWAGINRVLTAKNFADGNWPETTTAKEFYELEENSVDVLFLGSSHTVSAFLPQEIYNQYGITSYNLGMEQQSVVVSYWWLREALETQQPAVVVLDTCILFPFNSGEVLNSSESATRLNMDGMRFGAVKLQAVQDICTLDGSQSALSYFLTNIRYHTRWKDLGASDFLYGEYADISGLMGWSTASNGAVSQDYAPFAVSAESSPDPAAMVPLMETYLEKIAALCAEEQIELILVKTPAASQTAEKSAAVSRFAEDHGLKFYDFNEAELYAQTGFDFAADMADDGHVGLTGAQKLSTYMGRLLQDGCGLERHVSADWEAGRAVYADYLQDAELGGTVNLDAYLDLLQDARYTIFIAAKDGTGLSEQTRQQLRDLGLSAGWSGGDSYYAVIEGGRVRAEAMGGEALTHKGSFSGGRTQYVISSAGAGSSCSIQIDGTEYAVNGRGLNFVIYDSERRRVIDQVCFDTGSEAPTAVRN